MDYSIGPSLSILLFILSSAALAQNAQVSPSSSPGPRADPPADDKADAPAADRDDGAAKPRSSEPKPGLPQQVVKGVRPWTFNKATRYAHSLPEIDGPTITVTKKTSVVQLDTLPTIIDNNQRELFDRLPGIVLAEQQNPTELNLSYRGLGNPQESEYILLMQDGIPMEMDWIGYPTIYYLPVPQTIGSVQMIRAGSGLLYGPEPQPVINFISRMPDPTRGLAATTEQVGGTHDLFSSFNRISGTAANWDYLADYARRQSSGQRVNGGYTLDSGDAHVGYRFDEQQTLGFDLHAYSLDSGLAGLLSHQQYRLNPDQTTTPDDHLWADRYTGVVTYEIDFSARSRYTQKAWTGYQDLTTRSDTYSSGPAALGATLSSQRFHYAGLDGRWLDRWGRGNALTVGYSAYYSGSPYREDLSRNALAPRYDASGTPFYSDQRSTRYAAVFAENVFRFPDFHLVTSARLDHEQLDTDETVAPHSMLVNGAFRKNMPLFGVGIGNDFGQGNETYLNVSQGFRPLRYLDIASPFSNFPRTNNPDPTRYLTYEAGVHGWPRLGFYYDVSIFQVDVKDRIESEAISQTETIDVNTGNTRSRGAEIESSYDLLRLVPSAAASRHLDVFGNASLLNARFTSSIIPGQAGKVPAYAPNYVLKAGIALREDKVYKLSLVLDSVASQYFQDSDGPVTGTPARIPGYTVADFAADCVIAGHLRFLAGVSNLTNRRYYSRVFLFGGGIEPASALAVYGGVAYDL